MHESSGKGLVISNQGASIDLWRRLGKVPSDSLLGMAVRESLASYAGEGVGSAHKSWAGRFMHTVRSLSQGRDADGTIAEFLATNGLAEPDNDKLAAIPWLKVWGTWDTMLQEPWDKVAAYANPRQSVSSNLIKLSTYHSWFMTGDIPQEELEAGYPQGMPRYIRHTSGIPFTYVKQLMRFRTGAHHLAIETGRWARPKLPRQHRVCSKCSCTVVEDEVHFLFECPAYDYDYDYIMAPQRGRPYGANLGSMGRNTGTWSIRSECLSNITSWSRRKGIENTTLPFIPE